MACALKTAVAAHSSLDPDADDIQKQGRLDDIERSTSVSMLKADDMSTAWTSAETALNDLAICLGNLERLRPDDTWECFRAIVDEGLRLLKSLAVSVSDKVGKTVSTISKFIDDTLPDFELMCSQGNDQELTGKVVGTL